MKAADILLGLFTLCLCISCGTPVKQESIVKKKGAVYVLSFADCSLSVSAEKGGRVVSFKCRGNELLTSDSIHEKYYGATFWLSPQANYWPPYPSVDNQPYAAAVMGNKLRLTSMPDTLSGLSITKEFSVSEADTSVSVNYSIRNVSCGVKELAPWNVMRVHGGLSFFPVGEVDMKDKLAVTGSREDSEGIVWVPTSDGDNENAQKLYSTARGWLAHRYGSLLFVKCFPDIRPDEIPPGQGEVEIYVAPKRGYVELESHGKYTSLQPGDSLNYQLKWFLREMPVGEDADFLHRVESLIQL